MIKTDFYQSNALWAVKNMKFSCAAPVPKDGLQSWLAKLRKDKKGIHPLESGLCKPKKAIHFSTLCIIYMSRSLLMRSFRAVSVGMLQYLFRKWKHDKTCTFLTLSLYAEFFTFSFERGLIFLHHLKNYDTEGITYTKPSPWRNISRKMISHGKA